MEEWKDIKGFEGMYRISNTGKIQSLARVVPVTHRHIKAKLLKPYPNHRGYLLVLLSKDGIYHRLIVHRLVASHFIDNPLAKAEVNHIDGNKQNNYTENLEWVTRTENAQHAINILGKNQRGANHAQAKLSEKEAIEIIQLHKTGQYTYVQLGKMFKVNDGHIGRIIKGQVWKHLKIA